MGKKLIIGATMVLITTFLVGTLLMPQNYLMLFAGGGTMFTMMRAGFLVMLGILLYSNPPRKLWFRKVLGVASVLTTVIAIDLLFHYLLNVADAIVMIQVSIIFAIEALEAPERKAIALREIEPQIRTAR